ncbi:MAG: pre-peptidase C-terminal domain-containing protein [Bryobacterales bacterium]|nr:pre-peptidase C-terminal domain-containing protein [Bryobacterales bacterium]
MAIPKVCFDRVLPRNRFRPQTLVRTRRGGPMRAISPLGVLWMNGSTLRVRFLGGTASQKSIAREQALWWTEHANLKFEFGTDPNSEIRIAFDRNDGAWSYVGTEAREIPVNRPTMNLGFLDGGTAAHEFGHAIGLAHEHQNPAGGIEWNEAEVIRALAGPPNFWDEATARHNVLHKYLANQINGTTFDPDSIMLYFFPKEWTLNGVETKANEILSAMDKAFVAGAKMYPKTDTGTDKATVIKVNDSKRTAAEIGMPGEEDLFRFQANTAGTYTIETRGNTDVFMKLFGPDSETDVIAEDDDSGLATNARISRPLTAGEYYVQIRHYNQQQGTGKYSITVKKN